MFHMVKLPAESSDPKLKAAMEEIKAVLTKYDIAAVAILQSKTHGEWLNEITPSWSCAKMERDEKGRQGIRFKATLQEYGSKEARNEAIRLTAGMRLSRRGDPRPGEHGSRGRHGEPKDGDRTREPI